ncbi:MAG TPA: hypothetical protein VGI74_01395 [Streptosporangiaceae bacterium]|jgi:hypothetical protein
MRRPGNKRPYGRIGVVAGALVLSVSGFATSSLAVQAAHTGPVSATPAGGTPELTTPGNFEVIRQIVQCGSKMYAVGSFGSITQNGTAHVRHNIFSFSASPPYTMTSWTPYVWGRVNTIAFANGNCADAYIGGRFPKINNTPANNIAEISTATGHVIGGFAHSANGEVSTMAVHGSHMLTGGYFTSINGSPIKYYVSLNTNSGRSDGYVNFNISGIYKYPGSRISHTSIYNQQVSHGGSRVMVEGTFTSVGGHARQQIFQERLGPAGAGVTGWTSPDFSKHCDDLEPFYLRTAAWSPDDSTVYIGTTGGFPFGWNHTYPLYGICDVAAAFSASEQSVNPEWINYTGCNSLYAAASDGSALYVAGHPIYSENPNGCKNEGSGAIHDPGLQGLNPGSGHVIFNDQHTAKYSMSRANADDMLLTSAGLWIASTNRFGMDTCGHLGHRAGICFLPYRS